MEVTCSSETSVDLQRTTLCYIPENGTFLNHRCDNLKFYLIPSVRAQIPTRISHDYGYCIMYFIILNSFNDAEKFLYISVAL
jgi:hypothetical protein